MALRPASDRRLIPRSIQLLVGLFLYGVAIALIVRGQIGAAPWDVLTQGIALHSGLSFGTIVVITSGVVLLLWIPLKQWPGVGTVLNALLVGPAADIGLAIIPPDLPLLARLGLFVAGVLLLAVATGLYIGGHLGPGPRDGLMTGIHRRFGVRIWIARTSIEVVVVIVGWILGGNVGIGTLVFALAIGPLCQFFIPRLAVRLPETATDGRERQLEGSVAPTDPAIDSPAN